jgi:hypothetical protein
MHWYICLFFAFVSAWDVARTPPLGFNTWNKFGCSVTGQILMDTARAMVDSGLAAKGYVYVNVSFNEPPCVLKRALTK